MDEVLKEVREESEKEYSVSTNISEEGLPLQLKPRATREKQSSTETSLLPNPHRGYHGNDILDLSFALKTAAAAAAIAAAAALYFE